MGKKDVVLNRQYTDEFKVEAVRLSESIGGSQAAKRFGIPDSSLWNWIRLSRAGKHKATGDAAVAVKRSVTEVEGGEPKVAPGASEYEAGPRNSKKSGGVFRERVAVKYVWIGEHSDQYNVTRMCRQLDVSRTGYYQWKGRTPSSRSIANRALDAQVAAIHAGSGRSYGRPRIVKQLHDQGVEVGHERVRNSLKRQGLRPVYKKPYRVTTDSSHNKPIASNVLDSTL